MQTKSSIPPVAFATGGSFNPYVGGRRPRRPACVILSVSEESVPPKAFHVGKLTDEVKTDPSTTTLWVFAQDDIE